MIPTILPKMIKFNLLIQRWLNILTQEVFYFKIGLKKCNDRNNVGKIENYKKSTKTNSSTGHSGATILPPIGDSFMYIETSSANKGNIVLVSWENTDIRQISNRTFYYNRFSILSIDSKKSMGRFRFQLLLKDNTWSTR